MYVADYVLMEYGTGAIMAVPGARRARPRLRARLRPADPPRDRAAGASRRGRVRRAAVHRRRACSSNSRADFDGLPNREALGAIVGWLDVEGKGPRFGQLQAARLAGLAPALLGHADPDPLLRAVRRWCPVPDDQLPVELPDIEDYTPKGRSPLAAAEDWVNTTLPAVRRAGASRDRHDGHVRRFLLVLPALLRPAQRRARRGTRRRCASGCRSTSTSAASSTRSCT